VKHGELLVVNHGIWIGDIFLVKAKEGWLVEDGEERCMFLPEDVDTAV